MNPAAVTFESPDVPRWRLSLVREAESPYGGEMESESFRRPFDIVSWLWRHVFAAEPREVVVVVHLDTAHSAIGYAVAYSGCLARSQCEPRGILVPALLANAAAVILAHNHPSGDPNPSAEDLLMTRRLAEAGEIVGVKLLDHVIVGSPARWVSLHEKGLC